MKFIISAGWLCFLQRSSWEKERTKDRVSYRWKNQKGIWLEHFWFMKEKKDFTIWNSIYYIHRSYRWHHDTHMNISLDSFKFLNGRTMCMHFLFLVSSIAETFYRSWHSVVLSFLDDVYWKSDLLWTVRNFMKTAIWNPTEVGTQKTVIDLNMLQFWS